MRLKYEAKNAWEFERENNKLEDVMNYSKGYMHFLDVGKTERTSAREIVRMAKENGYISIDEAMNNGKVNPGDKIYAVNKDKAVALFIMGKNKLENGMKIIGGHIDSPIQMSTFCPSFNIIKPCIASGIVDHWYFFIPP